MGSMTYSEQIEEALGIREPGKSNVRWDMFDYGRSIGVAAWFAAKGKKWAVVTEFSDGWIDRVVAALREKAGYDQH
jgi:hypothetical protein